MYNKLFLHPTAQASASAVFDVSAQALVQSEVLQLNYRISGPIAGPQIKGLHPQSNSDILQLTDREDELWKSTCLEAFILLADKSYVELNLSPKGRWALYHFDSYRTGMKNETRVEQITHFSQLKTESSQVVTYELRANLPLSHIIKSPQHFRLGLTAVIETGGGERSYWSLKHAGEKPDFHDSRGHILEMRI